MDPDDVRLHERIPVTSPARTLLDLAEAVPRERVREALEQSQRLGLFDRTALDALLARSHGRRGLRILHELLADAVDDPPELRSPLEREFRDLLRDSGIPPPLTNVVVAGVTVDAYWPQHGVVVELDTYGYHGSHGVRARPCRDDRLLDAGLRVRRFTREQVQRRPTEVIRTLVDELADPE